MPQETPEEKPKKAKCPACGSGFVYVRIDDSIRCRACGYDTRKVKK